MLQALNKIELLSVNLSSGFMVAIGVLLLGTGLFVWLGGLRWHFLSAVVSGAFVGIVCASVTPMEFQAKAFCIAAAIAGLLVAALRKRSLVFITALIVVVSGLFLSALPAMNESTGWQVPPLPVKAEGIDKLSAADTFSVLKDVLFFMGGMIATHIKGLSFGLIIVSSIIASSILGVGLFFPRSVSSIGSSMLGTLFVFAGLIVLLLQKGSMPFSAIYAKPSFYQTLIICMIILGSVSGLLLCPKKRRIANYENKREKRNELI
jgi:hypothetical protein